MGARVSVAWVKLIELVLNLQFFSVMKPFVCSLSPAALGSREPRLGDGDAVSLDDDISEE